MKLKPLLFHIILPLLLGGMIYILFRSKTIYLFDWLNHLGFSSSIIQARDFSINIKNLIPKNILFYLPSFLWSYSFTSFMIFITGRKINKKTIYWIICPLFFGILLKYLQLFNIISGTFDLFDILIYFIAALFSLLNTDNFLNHKFHIVSYINHKIFKS